MVILGLWFSNGSAVATATALFADSQSSDKGVRCQEMLTTTAIIRETFTELSSLRGKRKRLSRRNLVRAIKCYGPRSPSPNFRWFNNCSMWNLMKRLNLRFFFLGKKILNIPSLEKDKKKTRSNFSRQENCLALQITLGTMLQSMPQVFGFYIPLSDTVGCMLSLQRIVCLFFYKCGSE